MKDRRAGVTVFILALLGFLIYSNVMRGEFIFDDEMYIVDNYRIKDISNLLKDFSGTRYIGLLTFAINYWFGGLNTFGYHLVNIIIHIINAMLVYVLVEAMGYGLWAIDNNRKNHSPIAYRLLPIACSLIFLVHPIQTQAVSYITQRFASLATLFYLLALVLYIKARKTGNGQGAIGAYSPAPIAYYILSILSAIFAMKTKEISFTLPFVIALYEFTFFKKDTLRFTSHISRFLYLLPFFLTLLIIPLELFLPKNMDAFKTGADAGEMIRQLQIKDIKEISMYAYFLTQFKVIVTYLRLLVVPVNQTLLYDYPISRSIFEPATFISFIFLLIIFSSAVYLYFRSRITHHVHGLLISFGILWFFITLSVESSIIPINDVIFEHRLYLPSIGFILSATAALFYGFNYLEKKTAKPLSRYLLSGIVVIAAIFSFAVYKRNALWSDRYLMYLDNVKKLPNNARLHNDIATIYLRRDMLDDAIQEYLIALRLRPEYAKAHYNLGVAYSKQGRLDEAIQEYLTAIMLDPNSPDAHYNLGLAYFKRDWLDEAIHEYLTAIMFDPNSSDAHYNLGLAYSKQGRFDEAVQEYQVTLRLEPDDYPEVHYNLGVAYYYQGRLDAARKEFEAVLKLRPDDSESRQAIESLGRK